MSVFKTTYKQVVHKIETIEAEIEADSEDQARQKLASGDFHRYLVTKSDKSENPKIEDLKFEEL